MKHYVELTYPFVSLDDQRTDALLDALPEGTAYSNSVTSMRTTLTFTLEAETSVDACFEANEAGAKAWVAAGVNDITWFKMVIEGDREAGLR